MNKTTMKDAILLAKQEKGLTWTDIAKVANLSKEFVCSACLGMNHLEKAPADAVVALLGLDEKISTLLQMFPHK